MYGRRGENFRRSSSVFPTEEIGRGVCCGTEAEEEARERAADTLLAYLPPDRDCPTYTEVQLSRHGSSHLTGSVEVSAEFLVSTDLSQEAREEIRFAASLSPLTRAERVCLESWLTGGLQREWLATDALRDLGISRQYTLSRRLNSALRKCREWLPISFTLFSRRTIYRRPQPLRGLRMVVCPVCGETFRAGMGRGRFCSTMCREQARSQEASK